jgi:hypothetical protein
MELHNHAHVSFAPAVIALCLKYPTDEVRLLETINATMKFLLPQYGPEPGLPGRSPPPQFGSLELCSLSVSNNRDASQQSTLRYPDLIGSTTSCHRLYFYMLIVNLY